MHNVEKVNIVVVFHGFQDELLKFQDLGFKELKVVPILGHTHCRKSK